MDQPELITAAMPAPVEAGRSEREAATPATETAGAAAKQFVRDLCDGQAVDSVFVVRDRARRRKRSGEDFLKLQLGDVTGAVEAVVWDGVEQAWDIVRPGAVVRVGAIHGVDPRYGATLTVKAVREATASEYEPADLLEGPIASYERMVADLRSLTETVREPHLSQLLERVFGEDSAIWERWRLAPAAKYYHQAYRHGLLEHSLSVAQGVSAISATFPAIDRDVAVTGALLHDIGKIEAYAIDGGAIEMTNAGRLQGEIPLGYYIVRREIESIGGFPEALAEAVLHIVLSHHGKLEHGSPVVPCTREATLVHMIDNLGGTLGSFDRIEKTLQSGERWSAFDRALSASAYFPSQAA